MKKRFFLLILLIIPIKINAYSSNAFATVLMDMDSNKVIYSNNMNSSRSVASISKIMTAILAIESNKLNDIVIIGDEISKSYGSGVYIKTGEEILLQDLVYALMLRSGNDASLSIAKYVGGSVDNFVRMMNEKANEIGMKNTVFNNPNGLDEKGGNVSTAYDMGILTSYAMKNDIYKEITSTKKYTLKTNMNYYSWTNKHKLLGSYKYITGGKTGFTEVAKRTLVTTASKENINLVAVTLNDGSDFSDHINMFEEAFENYTNYNILKAGNIEIIGESYYKDCSFYIKNDFSATLKNGGNKVVLEFKLNRKINYMNDDEIGYVNIVINNESVHKEMVYVKVKERVSWFHKIKGWLFKW